MANRGAEIEMNKPYLSDEFLQQIRNQHFTVDKMMEDVRYHYELLLKVERTAARREVDALRQQLCDEVTKNEVYLNQLFDLRESFKELAEDFAELMREKNG